MGRYTDAMGWINYTAKNLIELFVRLNGLEHWIRFVNRIPLISTSLKFRLILVPKPRVNTRKLDYLDLQYYSTPSDSLNVLARINFQTWETESRLIFSNLSKKADLILDIGAYSGIYSLIAARSSGTAKIVAFEPNPVMRHLLESNIRLNGFEKRIRIEECALADTNGKSVLTIGKDSSMARLNSPSKLENEIDSALVYIDVVRLDDFSFVAKDILMKVDIEGSESHFLRGAINTIKLTRPTILMEALNDEELESQFKILSGVGYARPVCIGEGTGDERNFLWISNDEI